MMTMTTVVIMTTVLTMTTVVIMGTMDGHDVQDDDADDVSGDRHGSSTGQQPVLQGSEEKGKTPRSLPGILSRARAATSIIFVATNTRQKYACRNETFVATKLCLSQQTRVCRDKTFVVTSILLS